MLHYYRQNLTIRSALLSSAFVLLPPTSSLQNHSVKDPDSISSLSFLKLSSPFSPMHFLVVPLLLCSSKSTSLSSKRWTSPEFQPQCPGSPSLLGLSHTCPRCLLANKLISPNIFPTACLGPSPVSPGAFHPAGPFQLARQTQCPPTPLNHFMVFTLEVFSFVCVL